MGIPTRYHCAALALILARTASAQGLQANPNPVLDHAVRSFWESGSEKDARSAISDILTSGADPDTVWRHFGTGRLYSARVPKGRLSLQHETPDGMKHRYTLVVPSTYDPTTPIPLRIYLHGRVETEERNSAKLWDFDRFGAGDGIALYPSAWRASMWWHQSQLDNILGIFQELKRTYNIDENRVHVIGVSDGGTGAWFLAFKVPTLFASFSAMIGHAGALVNPRIGALGPFYVPNLTNSPFFVVNGALDPLFPVREVAPYVALFRKAGVNLTFRPRADAGHDLRWWPEVAPAVDSFQAANPRNPFPDRITWEADDTTQFARAYWLRIRELGSVAGESEFPGFDSIIPLDPEPGLGVRADPASNQGVRLLAVELGSIAGRSGLQAGDKIVQANGLPTPDVPALLQATQGLGWGDSLILIVEHNGSRRPVRVGFGPKPDPRNQGPVLAFPRPKPTGRMDVERRGNEVVVKSRGVRRFSLLLSPAQFDLNQPVKVVANGRVVFEGLVQKRVQTMLDWALKDRDRTMLYLAELEINLLSNGGD